MIIRYHSQQLREYDKTTAADFRAAIREAEEQLHIFFQENHQGNVDKTAEKHCVDTVVDDDGAENDEHGDVVDGDGDEQ